MKTAFLIHNVFGIGGTVRTVVNLAAALSARHEVEIASVFRHRTDPQLALDDRVRVTPLVDMRPGRDTTRSKARRPSVLYPSSDGRFPRYSRLTDERVTAWLADVDADVVIGTRPGLNVMLAHHGPRDAVRIAQEHRTLDSHRPCLRTQLLRCYPLLDAVVTVTEADAAAYRSRLPGMCVEAIPNSVPEPRVRSRRGAPRVVVAAGRFDPGKRFELLVDAFAEVVAMRPDWHLNLYGQGPCLVAVRARIDHHALGDNVHLMGLHTGMETEWAKGAIAAVSSDEESFGMTIAEAMRCGLPVVSTDCPLGPREIIRHGRDGLLVPVNDAHALANALLRLINDDRERETMGRAASEAARRFDPHTIADHHEAFVRALLQEPQWSRGAGTLTARTRRTEASELLAYMAEEGVFRAARYLKHRMPHRHRPGPGVS